MTPSMPSGGACARPGAPDMCDVSGDGLAAAKATCSACPVLDACAAWLRTLDQPPAGVVAGISFTSLGAPRRNPYTVRTRPKQPPRTHQPERQHT